MKCVVLLFMIFVNQVLPRVLYEYRLNCAESIQEWNIRKSNYICPNQGTEYHCMQLPNGKFVEFCLAKIWIQPDYCPVFNASTGRINVLLCRTYQRPCPKVYFFSNELYKEPGCLISSKQQTTTTSTTSMQVSSSFNTVTVKRSTSSPNASTVEHHEQNGDTLYKETGSEWSTFGIACGIAIPVVVLCILLAVFTLKHRSNGKQKITLDIDTTQVVKESSALLSNADSENYGKESEKGSRDNETIPSVDFHNEGEEYIQPHVYKDAKNKLLTERVVILVGPGGSGKRALAEELVQHDYDHVLRKCREDSELPPERDERSDRQVILWHHFLGVWPLTDIKEKKINNMKKWILWATESKNHAIIFTFNFSIWTKIEDILLKNIKDIRQYRFKLDLSWNNQVDIAKLYLSEEERNKIMTSALKPSDNVGFPLLLSLYKLGFSTLESAFHWFEKPEECVHSDLRDIHQQHFKDYVTLIYCLLNGGYIDRKNVRKSLRREIERICQETTTSKSNVKSYNKNAANSLINETEMKESCKPISTTDNDNNEKAINEEHKMESTDYFIVSETSIDKITTSDSLQEVSGIQCSENELSVAKITLNDSEKNTEETFQTKLILDTNAQSGCSNVSTESESRITLNPECTKSNAKRDNDQAGHIHDNEDSRVNTDKKDTESSTEHVNSAEMDSSKTVNASNGKNGKKSKEKQKSKPQNFFDKETIEIPQLLEKYLTNKKKGVFEFRHEFLMHCLLRFHVDEFGKDIFRSEHIDKDLKSYVEQMK